MCVTGEFGNDCDNNRRANCDAGDNNKSGVLTGEDDAISPPVCCGTVSVCGMRRGARRVRGEMCSSPILLVVFGVTPKAILRLRISELKVLYVSGGANSLL